MSDKDTIYRQDAIRDIHSMDVCVIYDDMCSTEEAVEKAIVATKINAIFGLECMPSAEPRKKGKWIKIPEFCGDDVSGFIDNHFSCSECKKEAEINSWGFYILSNFCPNCGADMRGEKSE